jgi:hypothetical protein
VHDTSIVEHDIKTTPRVYLLDSCSDIGLLADIADSSFDLASSVRDNLLDLGKSLFESRCRDIAHQNRCTLAGKQNGGLKTNTTVELSVQSSTYTNVLKMIDEYHGGKCALLQVKQVQQKNDDAMEKHLPSSTSDDSVLASETTSAFGAHDCRWILSKVMWMKLGM